MEAEIEVQDRAGVQREAAERERGGAAGDAGGGGEVPAELDLDRPAQEAAPAQGAGAADRHRAVAGGRAGGVGGLQRAAADGGAAAVGVGAVQGERAVAALGQAARARQDGVGGLGDVACRPVAVASAVVNDVLLVSVPVVTLLPMHRAAAGSDGADRLAGSAQIERADGRLPDGCDDQAPVAAAPSVPLPPVAACRRRRWCRRRRCSHRSR